MTRLFSLALLSTTLSACILDADDLGDGRACSGDCPEDCGAGACEDEGDGGCGGDPCTDDNAGGAGGGWIGGPPAQFPVITASAFRLDDVVNVSMTDYDGLTSCGLAEDESLVPGVAARQVFVQVEVDTILACPEGVYPIRTCAADERMEPGCARFRAWGADGRLVGRAGSVGGTLRITRDYDWCGYEVEVAFPGGSQIRGSFELDELDVWEQDAVCTR